MTFSLLGAVACGSGTVESHAGGPDPDASSLTVDRASGVLADGADVANLTVTVRDAAAKPLAGYQVRLAATGSANILTQPAAATDVGGVATGTLAATAPGTKTVSAVVLHDGREVALARTVTVDFVALPAPAITSFTPTAQHTGGSVTINGMSLENATLVTFGGGPSAAITDNTDTSITAIVPAGSTSGSVAVTTADGTGSRDGFTLLPSPPTISSFAPTTQGAGGTVTITGTNLANPTSITFGGGACTVFTASATSIVATVPTDAASGEVSVTTAGGTATLAGFVFVPAPVIIDFDPKAQAAGGDVTITGTGLASATLVAFGGGESTAIVANTDTSITATVPPTAQSGEVSVTTMGGTATFPGFVFVPAPTISDFQPRTQASGAQVTITGTYLAGVLAVTFGSGSSATIVSNTDDTIVAVVPADSTDGDVSVTTVGGTATMPGFLFVPGAPAITDVSPASQGVDGSVTISGTNLAYALAVTFGGGPSATITENTAATITATVPAGSASGDVEVTTLGGVATWAGFTLVPAPAIASFTPATQVTGGTVQIFGTNLSGATSVTFGGGSAATIGTNTATMITATVPGDSASGDVAVTTPGGTATKAGFTFVPPPVITSFDPVAMGAGGNVTITGTGLASATSVRFGAGGNATIRSNTDTTIVAWVPWGSTSGDITVTTPGGTTTAAGFVFVSPPTITSFDPTSQGAGGSVTITGTNLADATSVTFGDGPSATITANTATAITAVVPAGSADGSVAVTTVGGIASRDGFVFVEAPQITSFTPDTQAAGGTVVITGLNLASATSVTFGGGVSAVIVSNSATSINAIVPAESASGDVSVTTRGGTAALAGFTFLASPTVTAVISPTAGETLQGCVAITYTVSQPQSFLADVAVELDATGTGTFSPAHRCTQAGGAPGVEPFGVQGVSTSPTGTTHTFLWNSSADIPDTKLDVALRVRASRWGAFGPAPLPVTGLTVANGTAFAAAASYATGLGATSVAAGQIDRDGILDLVVANSNANTISFLKGNGDGTFQAPVDFAVGASPTGVTIGDFDRDGRFDVVVTNGGDDTISWLKGAWSGIFEAAVTYDTGAGPQAATSADINQDGKLDVITANRLGDSISVLRGVWDGTLSSASTFAVGGSNPYAVVVADFNADGKPDVATANNASDDVSVLLSNGNRVAFNLAAPVPYAVGAQPYSIAAVDVDADGDLDLVTADGGASSLSVLLGNGKGTFAPAVAYATAGVIPASVAAGDVNGDGKADLLAASLAENLVSVHLGNGDGTFESAFSLEVGANPNSLALGDFNEDGKLDLATADLGADDVSVVLSTTPPRCDPGFAAPGSAFTGSSPGAVAAADLNGDGKPDLVTANRAGNDVSVFFGRGNGTYESGGTFAAGTSPTDVKLADMDGDGILDILSANYGSGDTAAPDGDVSVLLGLGGGDFGPAQTYPDPSTPIPMPKSLAVGDVNGDGAEDVVVVTDYLGNVYDDYGDLWVLLGDGLGGLGTPTHVFTDFDPGEVVIGDWNGDGNLDLANTCMTNNEVYVHIGNGDGTFTSGVPALSAGSDPEPRGITAADLNGDRVLDLITANYTSGSAGIFLGNGDGTFHNVYHVYADPMAISVGAADLDGDGAMDLVVTGRSSRITVLKGNGNGSFQSAVSSPTPGAPYSFTLADVNGDGRPDVVAAIDYAANALTFLGKGDGTFVTSEIYSTSIAPLGIAVGDIDSNGHLDMVLGAAYDGTHSVAVLKGYASPTFGSVSLKTVQDSSGATASPMSVALGDVNGDGRLDLLTGDGTASRMWLLLNGGGYFGTGVRDAVCEDAYGVALADLNHDGWPDAIPACSYPDDMIKVWANKQSASADLMFTSELSSVSILARGYFRALAASDLDQNGNTDFVITNSDDDGAADSDTIWTIHSDATGSISWGLPITVGADPMGVATGDLDGTLFPDIAVANYGSDDVTVILDSNMTKVATYPACPQPRAVAVGDVTGDGKGDVVVACAGSNEAAVLAGNGDGTLQPPVRYGVGRQPSSVAIFDANLDGKLDFVIANQTTIDVSVVFGR